MIQEDGTDPEGMEESPPVTQLVGFELPAESDFTGRVRRSIHRRETASDLLDLSVRSFLTLLLEYLSTLIEAVLSPSDPGDEEKEP